LAKELDSADVKLIAAPGLIDLDIPGGEDLVPVFGLESEINQGVVPNHAGKNAFVVLQIEISGIGIPLEVRNFPLDGQPTESRDPVEYFFDVAIYLANGNEGFLIWHRD
jgi:hypothetical protein